MPALLNGKQRAKSTKMVTDEKPSALTPPTTKEVEDGEQESKKGRLTLLKKLEPEMLSSPYPIELPGITSSDEFCLEKCSQFILEPLGDAIASEKEWLDFARSVWRWREAAEERRLESTADDAIARLQEDPRLLEMVRQKLADY